MGRRIFSMDSIYESEIIMPLRVKVRKPSINK